MSDTYSEIVGMKINPRRICRVAYTLNNTQPVVCTIIDEHPLFYMDYEDHYEDLEGGIYDHLDLSAFDGELEKLKQAIERFDTYSESEACTSEDKIEKFLDNARFIGVPNGEFYDAAALNVLEDLISQSRIGQAYMDFACEHKVQITLSSQVETAHYDRNERIIHVNGHADLVDQVFLLVRELRRHWQHRQGALIHPLMFHPDHAVLINRAQEADLVVSIIRVAWELQLAGHKEIWDRIENSSMADMGRAFAREAFLDFRTINNGQAMAAVFEAWFLSERCRRQDKVLINQMLADHQGYVFDLEDASYAVTPSLIAALGEMPFGKNYLAEHAVTIMDDAIFTDVRDRANANFLWFVKFERSFRETEQVLQPSSEQSAKDIRSSELHTEAQDFDHESAQQLPGSLHFFPGVHETGEQDGDKSDLSGRRLLPESHSRRIGFSDGDSNVVFLQRWRSE
ncbi:MAG: hypothetical protein KDI46_06470 [Alphaproteobacteria bacterium]|nr:hypothetical protein [Alphaproteobacteria bacterium]